MLARVIVKWLSLLVALVAVAAIADAVTVKTGPGRSSSAREFQTIRWNMVGSTDDGLVTSPANLEASDTFVVASNVTARFYAPAATAFRIIRFSVILMDDYDAANEKCTFSITQDGSTLESWSTIEAGDGGSPTCEFQHDITGSDLDAQGEICARVDSTGTLVSPGQYWQVISKDRSGSTDCEVATNVSFEVTIDFS